MAFWNESTLEPKRQFKFKVTLGLLAGAGGGANEGVYLAQSADRPTYTISDSTKVDFLDKSYHFPGKVTWNQVKLKFVDTTGGTTGINVAQRTFSYLQTSGYLTSAEIAGRFSEPAGMSTVSKLRAITALGNINVQVLNSTGQPVDSWDLHNPFITTVALNNLDYSAEGILTAEYTIRYDHATYSGPPR